VDSVRFGWSVSNADDDRASEISFVLSPHAKVMGGGRTVLATVGRSDFRSRKQKCTPRRCILKKDFWCREPEQHHQYSCGLPGCVRDLCGFSRHEGPNFRPDPELVTRTAGGCLVREAWQFHDNITRMRPGALVHFGNVIQGHQLVLHFDSST